MSTLKLLRPCLAMAFFFGFLQPMAAQTDNDADMMAKGLFCVGPMYSYSKWDNYWEGTLKRNNENLGTVSTQMVSVMGNYGVTKKLNLLFNLPFVKTKATAGTLAGQKGFQDLSVFVKWMPLKHRIGQNKYSIAVVAGFSTPLSDYTPDFLPLSIGLRSRSVSGRFIADYQHKHTFITGSAAYILRNNITIDRTAYYTTEMHYSNKVAMPDAASFNVRGGYRSKTLIAEAVFSQWVTLGGFDITRNNMPFPSNRMNMTTVGPSVKWRPGKLAKGFTFTTGADFTVAGRNVGKANSVYGGIFYILNSNQKN